jgi:CheY-like chemotaxis protein
MHEGSLREIVVEALEGLNQALEGSVAVHADLVSEPLSLWGDPQKLQHLVLDLCLFCAELLPPGGPLRLKLRPVEIENHPQLGSGPYGRLVVGGLAEARPEALLSELLAALFSGNVASTRRKGAILKLTLSSSVARAHKGLLSAAWEPGAGLRLALDLPLLSARPGPSHGPEEAAPPSVQDSGPAILVVDDEAVVREAAAGLLRHLGYVPLEAQDGAEALEVFRANADRVSLIILDMSMPGMSYESCVDALLQIRPGVKILLASGLISATNLLGPELSSKISGFLPKPFRLKDLQGQMRAALDSGA